MLNKQYKAETCLSRRSRRVVDAIVWLNNEIIKCCDWPRSLPYFAVKVGILCFFGKEWTATLVDMKISVITLFPEPIKSYMSESMMWKAQDQKLLELELVNLRDFGEGERRTVDDTPYGGGDGMLLKAEPVVTAIESVKKENSRVILLSPQGKRFVQRDAQRLSAEKHLILVCGRYEGFDERIRSFVDEQISVGDYVLTGGEIPAMAVIDSVVRLIPGVLGGENSANEESFADGRTLEYPHYTRPPEFRGMKVPDVLISGNHERIAKWRSDQATKRTDELHNNQ